jgi:hypothetical protein
MQYNDTATPSLTFQFIIHHQSTIRVTIPMVWKARVRFPAVQCFAFLYNVQTGSGTHPLSYASGLQPGVGVPVEYEVKTRHRNHFNLEPALIIILTKIRQRIEVLACQKQVQSSHYQVRTTFITDKIFNNIILVCSFYKLF